MSEPCPVPRRGAPDGDAAGHGAFGSQMQPRRSHSLALPLD